MRQKPAETPSAKELYEMIKQAAYFRAEKRGFAPGLEVDDWQQAEAEVLSKFRRTNGATPPPKSIP